MKTLSVFLANLVLVVSLASGSYAFEEEEGITFEPSLEVKILSGSTLYHISGIEYYPDYYLVYLSDWASELEWPVNATLAEVNLLWRGSSWAFDISVGKNLTGDTGEMKDSDWWFGQKDIYSESDTSMEALFIEAGVTYYNHTDWAKWKFGVKGGYKYQDFSFSAKDLDQWYPLNPEIPHDKVAGKVIDYKVTYNIPYLGIVVKGQPSEKLSLNGEVLYGWVQAKDEDDHLLRYKLSKGSCLGSALIFSLEGRYDFTPRLFMKVSAEVTDISTSGHQDQHFYSGEYEGLSFKNIDDEIKSSRTLLSLGLGLLF